MREERERRVGEGGEWRAAGGALANDDDGGSADLALRPANHQPLSPPPPPYFHTAPLPALWPQKGALLPPRRHRLARAARGPPPGAARLLRPAQKGDVAQRARHQEVARRGRAADGDGGQPAEKGDGAGGVRRKGRRGRTDRRWFIFSFLFVAILFPLPPVTLFRRLHFFQFPCFSFRVAGRRVRERERERGGAVQTKTKAVFSCCSSKTRHISQNAGRARPVARPPGGARRQH